MGNLLHNPMRFPHEDISDFVKCMEIRQYNKINQDMLDYFKCHNGKLRQLCITYNLLYNIIAKLSNEHGNADKCKCAKCASDKATIEYEKHRHICHKSSSI